MRDPQAQLPSVHSNRFEPTLGHCLMDSDPEVQRLTRANRRRSMLLSTLIQTSLLTAAIVLPLFASQTIPGFRNEPLIPSPQGMPIVDARKHGNPEPPPTKRTPKPDALIPPGKIPSKVAVIDDRDAEGVPDVGVPGEGCPTCRLDGVPGLDHKVFGELAEAPPPPKAPVTESKPRGPIRVSQPIQEAKLIHKVMPVYPPLMRQIRKSGRVELRAIIGSDGSIRELTLVSGDPGFVLAAQDAVLQWRYAPTLLNGEPVEVETRITVIFILNK